MRPGGMGHNGKWWVAGGCALGACPETEPHRVVPVNIVSARRHKNSSNREPGCHGERSCHSWLDRVTRRSGDFRWHVTWCVILPASSDL